MNIIDIAEVGIPSGIAAVYWCKHRFNRSAATVSRWDRRSRRKDGQATAFDIARSNFRVRRRGHAVRPHLEDHGLHRRFTISMRELGVPLLRVGLQRVWASHEDVILIVGGPRSGKSQLLAPRIIEAPGAVLVTTTRRNLHTITAPLREKVGPVLVFNPSGLGGLQNSVSFDPLTGCRNVSVATARAEDMVTAGGGKLTGVSNADFFQGQAKRVLATLMHGAAMDDRPFSDVHAWVANPEGHKDEIRSAMRKTSSKAHMVDVDQFLVTNSNTQSSTTTTVMPALQWMLDPTARAAIETGTPLDVAQFLRERGSLYLVGSEETSSAPLVTALTGHIAREARRIAEAQPGGRLDPPLTMALDEAALICPVPLEKWTSDMGGRGIPLLIAVQSRAQLVSRYGDADSRVIINNCGSVLLLGRQRDAEDLAYWSSLTGERFAENHSRDAKGKKLGSSDHRTAVISTSRLANLPERKAVLIHSGLDPVVGRIEQAMKRRDVKGAMRDAKREERRVVRTAETVTEYAVDHGVPTAPAQRRASHASKHVDVKPTQFAVSSEGIAAREEVARDGHAH